MFMAVCDMFRWLVPIPIFDDAPKSILCPRLLITRFEGSIFSFLF